MPEKMDEPRFSEEEFALILRRAIELDGGSAVVRPTPPPKMPPGGLTLSEIREIAVEVGIDPGRVLEAVDSLATAEWGPLARLFGGPSKMLVERSIGRPLAPEDMGRILESVREVMNTQGESHEVLGGGWNGRTKVRWPPWWSEFPLKVRERRSPLRWRKPARPWIRPGPAPFLQGARRDVPFGLPNLSLPESVGKRAENNVNRRKHDRGIQFGRRTGP